jgi:hypothetical protein
MNADLPPLEQARATREYIAAALPQMSVVSAVMVVVLADGGVLEITVPEALGTAWILGHAGSGPPDWVLGLPGWIPAAMAFAPRRPGEVRVRLARPPDSAGGEPVPLAEVIAGLTETYAAAAGALRAGLERMARGAGRDNPEEG